MDIGSFVRLSAKITAWHRNYLVLVYTSKYSILGVKFGLILVLRSQSFDFLRETLYKHAQGRTCKRLIQKQKWFVYFLPTVNAYLLLTSLKVCDWSGHIFGASASPRSLTIFFGYVTLFHCPWRSAWYQICEIRDAIACAIRGWRNLGFKFLNHIVLRYLFQFFIYRIPGTRYFFPSESDIY